MSVLDWAVLLGTIGFIVAYGAWKSRGVRDMASYLRDDTLRWPTIGLSIMATQASAITFLSTPGQAYADGMRFVQFYFGLPLAMVVIAAVFVPMYRKLNVLTAYEYLEHRFDARVRYLGAVLFLVQRGLAAGITIYAPSIILSSILGWSLRLTCLAMGLLVIGYTLSGGVRAVSQTQKQQMVIMLGGLVVAAVFIVFRLPDAVSFGSAVKVAGALGRMNAVSFELDFENRYNFWSGITGGFFLALSYFGTDQSQVQRYLSGRSVAESRLGPIFNGVFKVPMQVGILFVGVLVFVFYLFVQPPLYFNASVAERLGQGPHAAEVAALEARHAEAFATQKAAAERYVAALDGPGDAGAAKAELQAAAASLEGTRKDARALVTRALPKQESRDTDYVFLAFVLRYLPAGLVGLLIAVILCAAMSSIASELTALGSTTVVDLYKRLWHRDASSTHDLLASKAFTVLWGLVAIGFAFFAGLMENLIEAVNILGSIFYGTVLGLFVVAFFLKRITATPVLVGALVAQASVIALFFTSDLGFLWFNVVGCAIVVLVSAVLQAVLPGRAAPPPRLGLRPRPRAAGHRGAGRGVRSTAWAGHGPPPTRAGAPCPQACTGGGGAPRGRGASAGGPASCGAPTFASSWLSPDRASPRSSCASSRRASCRCTSCPWPRRTCATAPAARPPWSGRWRARPSPRPPSSPAPTPPRPRPASACSAATAWAATSSWRGWAWAARARCTRPSTRSSAARWP